MPDFKTYSQKPVEVERRWILIDAKDAPLGRIATSASKYLIGKYKPSYTPHIDGGDYVIVINAAELVVIGAKETDKMYHNYSGFPGGLKSASLKELREKYPERIIGTVSEIPNYEVWGTGNVKVNNRIWIKVK